MLPKAMEPGGIQDGSGARQLDSPNESPSFASAVPTTAERAEWVRMPVWFLAAVLLLPLLGVGFLNDDFVGIADLGPRGWALVVQELPPRTSSS
jgi:hypothetical protein